MLPAVTAEQALRWRRRVPRVALSLAVALPLLALVTGELALDTEPCTPASPCRLPLDSLAYHLVPLAEILAMGLVALALVLPRAAVWGAVVAAALLAGPAAVDSSFPSLWRWALGWFVVLAAADLVARWQQLVESASWNAPRLAYPEADPASTDRLPRDEDTRLAGASVAALALVAAGGLLAWHLSATAALREREARSITAEATVVQADPDGTTITVDVAGRRTTHEPLESYQVGDRVPVLVDPHDPAHVELVAEPDDPSWRIGVAGLLLVALLGVAGRLWSRGARRAALARRGGPAMRLRVGRRGSHVLLAAPDDHAFRRPLALVGDLGPSGLLLPLTAGFRMLDEDDEDDVDDLERPEPEAEPPDVTTLSDAELAAWADAQVELDDEDDDDVPPPPPVPLAVDGGAVATVIGLRQDGDPVVVQLDDEPPLVSIGGVRDPWTWGWLRDRLLRVRSRERGDRPGRRSSQRSGAPSNPWAVRLAAAVTPVAPPLAYVLALAAYPVAHWVLDGRAGWIDLVPIVLGGSTAAEGAVFLAAMARPPLGVRDGALLHRGRWMDELIPVERVQAVTAGHASVVLRLSHPDDALALPPQAVERFADHLRREPTPEQAAFAVEQLLRTTTPSGRRGWRRPSPSLAPGAILLVGLLAAWAQAHFG